MDIDKLKTTPEMIDVIKEIFETWGFSGDFMGIDKEKTSNNMWENMNRMFKSMAPINIIIMGKTGVGKSTLINSVFRKKLANAGVGRPVTDNIRALTRKHFPLTIYDTPGFELGKDMQDKLLSDLKDLIIKGKASEDERDKIHCIWYCINAAASKIELEEIKWIRQFTEDSEIQVPVIVVLTKALDKEEAKKLQKEIEKEDLNIMTIVRVLSQDKVKIKAYGLDRLISETAKSIPEEKLDAFAHVVKDRELKKRRAREEVSKAIKLATVVAATPIPVADSVLLVPIQVKMLACITIIYGLEFSQGFFTTLVSSVLGVGGAVIVGKTVAANLLKLIPGGGTAVGSVITAATAAIITKALGNAYISIMDKVCSGEINKEEFEKASPEIISHMIQDEINKTKHRAPKVKLPKIKLRRKKK